MDMNNILGTGGKGDKRRAKKDAAASKRAKMVGDRTGRRMTKSKRDEYLWYGLYAVGAAVLSVVVYYCMDWRTLTWRNPFGPTPNPWRPSKPFLQGKQVKIVTKKPKFSLLVDERQPIWVLAETFEWAEGPVWVNRGDVAGGGFLLFSDVKANTIYKWQEDVGPYARGAKKFLNVSGYFGEAALIEPGSNGLLLDAEGKLVLCEHGNRRITRMEFDLQQENANMTPTSDTPRTVLTDSVAGKKFNSPNDAIFDDKGNLYFTDPSYGLPLLEKDPTRELPHNGLYLLRKGEKEPVLLSPLEGEDANTTLTRPNGLALSPEGDKLYVSNSDSGHNGAGFWKVYDVKEDGTLENGAIFANASDLVRRSDRPYMPGFPDGLKVDRKGHVWATGPGGVYIFGPDGKLMGQIGLGKRVGNLAFGPHKTLFIAADDMLLKLNTEIKFF